MYHTYPKSVRAFRLGRGAQIVLDIAVALSSALFVSYLILHGMF